MPSARKDRTLRRLPQERGPKVPHRTHSLSASNLLFMKYGVGMARRGWLEGENVLNTWSAKEILDYLK
ncbi:MAG: hypothetical protein JSV43_06915 [Methanobacteriota archaeon]|nr:MAG: hypothetical protein JSV43_06915 [Euryarchaeota archaeon]